MDARLAYLGPDDPTEEQLLARLYAEPLPLISCDVETISTTDQTIIGIGLGLNCRESVYFQVFPQESRYLDLAWSILDRAGAVVLHNGIFDLTALMEYLLTWPTSMPRFPRYEARWKELSKTVKRQAYHSCQVCGSKYRLLTHHSDGLAWNNTRDNLVCVCSSCHDKLHDIIASQRRNAPQGRMEVPGIIKAVAAKAHDTSLALQVQGLGPLNLQWTAHNYAGTEIDTISDILPARKTMLDIPWEDTANKCLHDCQATLRLWHQMRGPEWGKDSLTWSHEPNFAGPGFDPTEPTTHYVSARMQDCYEIDRQLIALLLRMTARGIALRQDRVQEWYQRLSREKLLYQDICTKEGFNPGSNQQVGYVLAARGSFLPFTKTRKQLKVDEEILETLSDPLAAVVLEYRKRDKQLGTYFRPCLNQRRVYTHFRQDLSTSRLSSANINLQNWPELARDVLAPDNGTWTWMDFSQLEARIMAEISQDPALLKLYTDPDGDIHWLTQQALWPGTPYEDSRIHVMSKTFNFAMQYRARDYTLAKHTKLPVHTCREFQQRWLDTYSGVNRYQLEIVEQGWQHGWVEDLYGRRCRLPTLDTATPDHIEKCAINYPIQCTGAGVTKRAMLHPEIVDLDQALQVHDEILTDGDVEFPSGIADLGALHTPFKTKHSPIWV